MTRAATIARRELTSYFYSPVAYAALTLFLLIAGGLFWGDFQPGQPAVMRSIFVDMVWMLVAIIPILCMGLLSQEWASGTIETMMTAPLTEADVVLGKFLGSFAFYAVLLAPTLLYVALLRLYGRPDYGPIAAGYLGLLLVGALFISVSLFCSSLTRSQVVAAVSSIAILGATTVVPWFVGGSVTLPTFWRHVVDQCVMARYADFGKGVVDLASVVFFVGVTGLFLFVTVKVLESRRWK